MSIYMQLNGSDTSISFIDGFNFLCKSTLPHYKSLQNQNVFPQNENLNYQSINIPGRSLYYFLPHTSSLDLSVLVHTSVKLTSSQRDLYTDTQQKT